MKTRHFPVIKFISLILLGAIFCFAEAGHAAQQWNAKTTARVNLRKQPTPRGLILSIVPQDHRIRILEKDGSWYRVDVAGNIHGKGWLHADFVEKSTSDPHQKEFTSKAGSGQTEAGQLNSRHLSGHQPGTDGWTEKNTDRPADVPPEDTATNGLGPEPGQIDELPPPEYEIYTRSREKTPPPAVGPLDASAEMKSEGQTGIDAAERSQTPTHADVLVYRAREVAGMQVAGVRHNLPGTEPETGLRSHWITSLTAKTRNSVSSKDSPEPRPPNQHTFTEPPSGAREKQTSVLNKLRDTPKGTKAPSAEDAPPVGKPSQTRRASRMLSGDRQKGRENHQNGSSPRITQGNTAVFPEGRFSPGTEKKPSVNLPENRLSAGEKGAPGAPAGEFSGEMPQPSGKISVQPTHFQSQGPIRVALKLLSMTLSCLVVVLLGLENKTA